MNLSKLEKTAVQAVKQAARIWDKGTGTVKEKNGAANIVTEADLAVQRFLQNKLGKLLPNCGFLCEEENVADLQKEYLWVKYKDRNMSTAGKSICIFKCDLRKLNFRGLVL